MNRERRRGAGVLLRRVGLCATVAAAVLAVRAGAAVAPAQVDTFQDDTVDGWTQGAVSPTPTSVILSGGPAGSGDAYLQNVSSGNFGAGGRMVMFNSSQWAGNYLAAGINRFTADMANFGATDLFMRVELDGEVGNDFASAVAVDLPADGAWHSVSFDLTAAGLTNISGTETVAQGLSNVSSVRILSAQSGPARNGDSVAGTLGVDNIRAVPTAVPEPSTLGTVVLLAMTALPRRGRRRGTLAAISGRSTGRRS